MQNTPVSQLGELLQVRFQRRRVEPDGGIPGGLLQELGQVLNHFSGILVEQRVVFHEKAVVVLLQNGLVLEEGLARRTSRNVLRSSRLELRPQMKRIL